MSVSCFQASFLLDGSLARPHHGRHPCDRRQDKGGVGGAAPEG